MRTPVRARMIVVSDTTRLRHLIAIGEVELLPKLYGTVIVPGAVWTELQTEATPRIVKTWLGSPPQFSIPWIPASGR